MNFINKIWRIVPSKHKLRLIILIFWSLIISILELIGIMSVIPILNFLLDENYLSTLIDEYNFVRLGISANQLLIFFVTLLLAFFIIKALIISFYQYYNFKTIFLIKTKLCSKILKNYINYSYKVFFKKKSTDMIRNISREVDRVCTGILSNIISICTDTFLFILLFFTAVYFKLSFSLISIFFLLLISFFIIKFLRKNINMLGMVRLKLESAILKNLQEIFFNFKEIKVFEKEIFFLNRFDVNNKMKAQSEMLHGIYAQIPRIVIEIVAVISFFILLFYLTYNFEKKDIMPILGVYAVALFRIAPSISRLVTSVQNIRYDIPALTQIYKEITHLQNKKIKNYNSNFSFQNEIVFKDISFSYPGSNREALSKVNLNIKKNSINGIFGPTGSGKTTLVEIFSGFLMPSKGQIIVDQKKIKNYSTILKKISYVPQNVNLINDTFKQNIIFGSGRIDKTHFRKCINISCLNTFTKKIKNYNMNMGEFGKKISGGEKQRIGIARALYKKSEILILDEATNALDLKTEKKLLKNLKIYCKNITVIFITHKKENLSICGNVILLK
jgi:ABC-type multidrug transport system fused ATPase/permease subunit